MSAEREIPGPLGPLQTPGLPFPRCRNILGCLISQLLSHSLAHPIPSLDQAELAARLCGPLVSHWNCEDPQLLVCRAGFLEEVTSHLLPLLWFPLTQFEDGILDICLMLLDVNPKFLKNSGKDCSRRSRPVYVGRVVSAMVSEHWVGQGSRGRVSSATRTEFRKIRFGTRDSRTIVLQVGILYYMESSRFQFCISYIAPRSDP